MIYILSTFTFLLLLISILAPFYIVAAAIDLKGIQNTRYNDNEDSTYIIGDYNFDPLGLYPIDDDGKQRMQLAEIKHGRLSMIAITAFAVQEFVSKVGVVDETPMFFKPLF